MQRTYVDTMAAMVINPANPAPDDAKMLAWGELNRLKNRIATAAKANTQMDEYTKVHLAETLMRINRALDARVTVGSAAAAGSGNPFAALMGGETKR